MTAPHLLTTPEGRKIAYHQTAGAEPGVVFLGGLRSDMTGTKAQFLQDWAKVRGRAFLRFDYSGHGASDGRFEDGCIGDWLADARAVLGLTRGPQVLVGSSMGGWIALLLARAVPERVAGLVTVAAAPDFTEEVKAGLSDAQHADLQAGHVALPSAYGPPLVLTARLIADGARHLVLLDPLDLPFPVRMLQGTADADVPMARALALLRHATGPDICLSLVKGADHRFSTPQCLAMIAQAVGDVSGGL